MEGNNKLIYQKILLITGCAFAIELIIQFFVINSFDFATFLGRPIGILFWSLLICSVIQGVNYMIKRKFNHTSFYKTFLTIWIIFTVCSLVSTFNNI
jgi:hypothetical protein